MYIDHNVKEQEAYTTLLHKLGLTMVYIVAMVTAAFS